MRKKILRGHLLSWLDGTPATDAASAANSTPVSVRAGRALQQLASGELDAGEPLVHEVLQLMAGSDSAEPPRVTAAPRGVRERLRKPRDPGAARWPYELAARYRIVLPQRHRVSTERVVLAPNGESMLLLVRDFRSVPPDELRAAGLDPSAPQFEPLWRVFRMSTPRRPMRELLAFTQQLDRTGSLVAPLPVHLASHDGKSRLWIDSRSYTLSDSWQFEEAASLQPPDLEEGTNRLHSIAFAPKSVWAVWEGWEDDCRLLRFGSDGSLEADVGLAGSRAARVFVDRHEAPIVCDLMTLSRYDAQGELVASRDFSPFFAEFRYRSTELLVALPEGGFWLSNGAKVIEVSDDLSEVRDEWLPAHPVDALAVDETHLTAFAVDIATATAMLHVYRR